MGYDQTGMNDQLAGQAETAFDEGSKDLMGIDWDTSQNPQMGGWTSDTNYDPSEQFVPDNAYMEGTGEYSQGVNFDEERDGDSNG